MFNRVPVATYRLQFNRLFTFQEAAALVGYLQELGISDVYASPLFKAGPESTHGYDICDFEQLNPNLGTPENFDDLSDALRSAKMGLLLDMVPNHMGNDLSNEWWMDVLQNGEASAYAHFFDIDWDSCSPALRHKVLLPILEDHYGKVLEAAKLKLVYERGQFALAYYDRKFPIALESCAAVLQLAHANCEGDQQCSQFAENLSGLLRSLDSCDLRTYSGRHEFLKALEQLHEWHEHSAAFRAALGQTLSRLNGKEGDPSSFDRLHALVQQQHYRLAYWRVGPEEINYRRFFDVTGLVSMRMELQEVFDRSHLLIFSLLKQGEISGLRIDHPDGLRDPREYFRRVQSGFHGLKAEADDGRSLYVVAEKILSGEEDLPHDWPVAGTTGYDFLNQLNGIFIAPGAEEPLDKLYARFSENNGARSFGEQAFAAKLEILERSLISELNSLANRIKRLADGSRYGQDLPFSHIKEGLAAVVAAFPVYRTYVAQDSVSPSEADRKVIVEAMEQARHLRPEVDSVVYDFLFDLLLLKSANTPPELQAEARTFVGKFQQLTGPVMAKGLEDTTFYRFNRFVALNEVGGEPDRFGNSLAAFHDFNLKHARNWPHSLLATATHDTKRGEDLRARLNVLSEMPANWSDCVLRWKEQNADKKTGIACNSAESLIAPSGNDEYLFYQTLVGAWTREADSQTGRALFTERMTAYMLKAAKEAKLHTSWTDPNTKYEDALKHFIAQTLAPANNAFFEDFARFQRTVDYFGRFNSLSQVLLKLTSPGVPDFYQGTELWDYSLVDPDNRRPVDYELRSQTLDGLKSQFNSHRSDPASFLTQLIQTAENGAIKMFLIWRALQFRNGNRELFADGDYVSLQVTGAKANHVCAFARTHKNQTAICVAPRLIATLTQDIQRPPIGNELWGNTAINAGALFTARAVEDAITGGTVKLQEGRLLLGDVLQCFPAALIRPVGNGPS